MDKEWTILIALFRATVEQSTALTGQTKRDAKVIFNRWQKEGFKLVDLIEKNSNQIQLENATELIENSVNQLRIEF